MRVELQEIRGVTVVRLRGKITIGVGDIALRNSVQEALAAGASRILLDLADVTTIDSSGWGELISAYTTTTNRSVPMWSACPREKLIDVLITTQLILVIPIFPTLDDALESILEASVGESSAITFPDKSIRKNLHLGTSNLWELPADLGGFKNLQRLFISYGGLTSLPAEIGQLSRLERLFADFNNLVALPPEIAGLQSLVVLSLTNNKLIELPREIGQLENLEALLLEHNDLRELPSEIGDLAGLVDLSLAYNKLSHLPPTFGNLSRLPVIDLRSTWSITIW